LRFQVSPLPLFFFEEGERGRTPVFMEKITMTIPTRLIDETIDGLLKENVEAQAAFKAICARGCDEQFARDEIGRALLACLWEEWNHPTGHHDRLNDVFRLLENGRTTAEIFPDDDGDDDDDD
jgi:hypothetical protein